MSRDGGRAPAKTAVSRFAVLYCSFALLLFGLLSYTAAASKSATYDEPVHIAAAYAHLRYGDFRVEPDHPPLWKYWAAFPLLFGPPVEAHIDSPRFRDIPRDILSEWPWSVATVYQTPENDPTRMVGAARFMMLLLGVALGATIAVFAYRAAGPVAACVAVTLFTLDPNFLAHAPLVKNDVPLALATTALAYTLWRAGHALTWPRLLAVAFLCAACVATKFTGLLAAPIVAVAFLVRAALPAPWPVLGRTVGTRTRRLLVAFSACLSCAMFTYFAIWAVYLFRFNPAPDPDVHYDTNQFLVQAATGDLAARLVPLGRHIATPEELAAWHPSLSQRTALFALQHHLFPESFLSGLLYADAASRFRYAYLLGTLYPGGRWSYFPIAFLVKTPLATLATILLAATLPLLLLRHRRGLHAGLVPSTPRDPAVDHSPSLGPIWFWTCLALPALFFAGSAVTSRMNIGLRHLFPAYPPLYIAAGVAAARLYSWRPRLLRPAFLVLALGLAIESFTSYPDYIPFFNAAAGGARGGYRILGDSNLDWGQDLPLLAEWQRKHPNRTLYLAYFGTADPAYYGIRYRDLPWGYSYAPGEPPTTLPSTGVVAISVGTLQGILFPDPPNDHTYDAFRHRRPDEVLGGSIYLFDLGGD